jgi:hypothetical protein
MPRAIGEAAAHRVIARVERFIEGLREAGVPEG